MSIDLQAWQAAGAHYGYSRSRRHPSTLACLYGVKNRTDIINLDVTAAQMQKVAEVLASIKAKQGELLFVGTKPEARAAMVAAAEKIDAHYVDQRWIGGTLTNFSEIKKRIDTLNDLSEKRDTNKLVYKTKKERLMIERKITKLEGMFGGVRNLTKMPSILVVVDPRAEDIAVAEATKKAIPVIALANTDCDLGEVTYPICANDASRGTIQLFFQAIVDTYQS